jgi:peroxiredoxin
MKYLILLLGSFFGANLMAQKSDNALSSFRFYIDKSIDSAFTQSERDSFKLGLMPFSLTQRFEQEHKKYQHKRDSIFKKLGGLPVPDFEARDTAGLVHRPAHYRGRVVLLHFWRFWDFSFQNEIPRLNDIIEKYRKDGLEILSFTDLSLEKSEKAYLEQHPVLFPIIENADKFGDIFLPIRVNKPYIVFVDKYGRMRYFLTQEDMRIVISNVNEKAQTATAKPVSYNLEDKIVQLLKE